LAIDFLISWAADRDPPATGGAKGKAMSSRKSFNRLLTPLLVLAVILLALMLAARLVRADDGRPWKVYQNSFLCCEFFNLSSAQAFVRMQEPYGNIYLIVRE
jgi:hypothetical protein